MLRNIVLVSVPNIYEFTIKTLLEPGKEETFLSQDMFRVRHHSSSVNATFLTVPEFPRSLEHFTKHKKITMGLCQQYAYKKMYNH